MLSSYVEIAEDLGASEVAPYLLDNLRSENVLTRRMSAEILFRLELGKVPVEDGQARYLNTLYKLVQEKDPNYFVEKLESTIQRLDVSGTMGVTDGEGKLVGHFVMG